MVKDFKYIIKRILIGVGIVLLLSFIRGNLLIGVDALTINSTSACVIGGNNNSVCSSPPVYDTYSPNSYTPGYNVWFQSSGLLQTGGTYYIEFRAYIRANNPYMIQSDMQLYTGNNGSAGSRAYPDRNEAWQFYQVTSNQYLILWTFELDSYSNFDTLRFSWSTANVVPSNNYSLGLDSSSLIINGGPSGGGGGSSSSNADIINNQNSNTQNIINNNNNNTQNIINNNNSNTQEIIDNQNANTQAEIESQKACNTIDKNSISIENKYLNSSGVETTSVGAFGITNYIDIEGAEVITKLLSGSSATYNCFYNENRVLISCSQQSLETVGSKLTIPSNTKYVRFTIERTTNKPRYSICKNGNQAIVDSQNQLNDTLTDDSGGEVSSSWFDDFREDSNSPVSDLLTMPITLLQAYVNGFSGTCQAMNLGALYGTYIVIPCINIEEYIGSTLWNTIDVLFCIFMVYNIAMLCIHIYESITSLDDSMQYLYSPQHAASPSTRVERNSDLY